MHHHFIFFPQKHPYTNPQPTQPTQLPLGMECIEDYRLHKRQCVFSNDEFLCNAVTDIDSLSNEHACGLYQVFEQMVAKEDSLRKAARSVVSGSETWWGRGGGGGEGGLWVCG